eukprot:c11221_g1_i1 orf=487-1395(+)
MGVDMVTLSSEGRSSPVLKAGKTEVAIAKKLQMSADDAITKKKVKKKKMSICTAEKVVRKNKIQPLIIHSVSPPLIHAEPSNFMRIVQSLTGCDLTRMRCKESSRIISPSNTISATSSSPCNSSSMAKSAEGHEADLPPLLLHEAKHKGSVSATALVKELDQEDDEAQESWRLRASGKVDDHDLGCDIFMSCERDEHEESSSPFFLNNEGDYEMSSSPCTSADAGSCSLQLDGDLDLLFDSQLSSAHNSLYQLDSSPHHHHHEQHLESTVDSYLEHLLFSYDRNVHCKFIPTSVLADVCDPL